MRKYSLLLVPLLCIASAFAQTGTDDNSQSLGDIARQTRQQHNANSASGRASKVFELTSPEEATERVRDLLEQRKYEELELMAERVRSSRKQLPGGIWQLQDFYLTISEPLNKKPSDADWQALADILKQWQKAVPGSFTAKIALAQLHVNWSWKARGSGYADSVPEAGWKGFGDHLQTAMSLMNDPEVLNSNCPYRYSVLMQLALGAGLDKSRMAVLFERAIEAEPDYYHYYRYYANYLQEKWYGDPGEAVAFAEKSAREVGGQKGDFIYFEIASVLGCDCGSGSELHRMSWPRIKDGYAAMESLYGTTMVKRNRMAYMATAMNDLPTAKKMFEEIGDTWEPEVWRSASQFQSAKAMAMAAPPSSLSAGNAP